MIEWSNHKKVINLINWLALQNDHTMFIWRGTSVFFSLKIHQNTKILWWSNVASLTLYMYVRSSQVLQELEFYFKIIFTSLSCWQLLMSLYDMQHWNSNNICDTCKINEKLRIFALFNQWVTLMDLINPQRLCSLHFCESVFKV